MENKRLSFDIDANDIDIKPLLKNDFLELSMKPISDINPNANKSWFTLESLQKAIDSGIFRNKPILGYFENDDFVSHNGDWKKDADTGLSYWDTLGKKGERILGSIRESDEISIIQDNNGLNWIKLTCALWTQYSFKQVKRLLKDAKMAKKTGKLAKHVSVEVDITNYEKLANGVIKINEFNLVGITILGSRNGVPVEPGIQDAELSVVDIMGRDIYDKQMQGLRLAYEKLDNSELNNKEVNGKMYQEEENLINTSEANPVDNPDPESRESTPVTEEPVSQEQNQVFEADAEDKPDGESGNNGDGDGEKPEDQQDESCHQNNECDCGEGPERNPVRDIVWLVNDCTWNIDQYSDSIKYYEEHEDIKDRDYILSVLNRLLKQALDNQKELTELLAKIANDITEEDKQFEDKLCKYSNVSELIANYEKSCEEINILKESNKELSTKLENVSGKLCVYETKEFLHEANSLIKSASNLTEEQVSAFYSECEKGTITSLEDLKTKVALQAFENTKKEVEDTDSGEATSFSSDVYTPAVGVDPATKDIKLDRWGRMRKNVGK